MAETICTESDLQTYFQELKKHSVTYKLGQMQQQQTAGDEMQNPLQKQFGLVLGKIEEILIKSSKDSEEYVKLMSMKTSIIYEKAKILLAENLLPESLKLLEEALDLIKDLEEHPKIAFLHMRIVNHMTYVLSRLGQLDQAKEMLTKAIDNETKYNPEVYSTDDLFLNTKKDPKISEAKLTRLTINNLQMLAWIQAKMGNTEAHLKLQHEILQRQLDVAEGDVLRWAESCFRLANVFVNHGDFQNGVYHLIAAEEILNPLEVAVVPNLEVCAAQADLARSWVFYGLQLFEMSRKPKIPKDIEPENLEEGESSKPKTPTTTKQIYLFQGLKVEIPQNLTMTQIENKDQAQALFTNLHKWIKRARLFYTLRNYPLQYVNLCLDLSELYRFVSFYEEDIDSQYSVQKRRYDALETLSQILKEMRPTCYVMVNVELTRELIEVQMEMMNLNLKKLYSPTDELKTKGDKDSLKRQIDAFSNVHDQLENVASTLDMEVKKIIAETN
ncbi:unnamed protein product [Ceutorhynchus assimilis]|uniref:KIF-binding protein n=1 Tax=Ceutorhynchus assimilis TaxID=467358 RepID=A0A9N9MIH4_9CUCU|nr:unnamed protein product [Ceutorhynchus assimilis]